jgi:hypothetical protein
VRSAEPPRLSTSIRRTLEQVQFFVDPYLNMKTSLIMTGIAALLGTTNAHATFQDLWVQGDDKKSTCARLPLSNSPVTDVTSNNIRCKCLSLRSVHY